MPGYQVKILERVIRKGLAEKATIKLLNILVMLFFTKLSNVIVHFSFAFVRYVVPIQFLLKVNQLIY